MQVLTLDLAFNLRLVRCPIGSGNTELLWDLGLIGDSIRGGGEEKSLRQFFLLTFYSFENIAGPVLPSAPQLRDPCGLSLTSDKLKLRVRNCERKTLNRVKSVQKLSSFEIDTINEVH